MSKSKTTRKRNKMTLEEVEEKRDKIRINFKQVKLEKKYAILSEESDAVSISQYSDEIETLRRELCRLRKVKYNIIHIDKIREKNKINSLKNSEKRSYKSF